MTEVDRDKLAELVAESQYLRVEEKHGEAGRHTLRELLLGLKKVYTFVDPERCDDSLVVFTAIEDSVDLLPTAKMTEYLDFQSLAPHASSGSVIQVLRNGRVRLWNGLKVNLTELAENAVVYHYASNEERLQAKDYRATIPRLLPSFPSIFAIPAFPNLRLALEHYQTRLVRRSSCPILTNAWFDENRLFVTSEDPEAAMRNSLTQHLVSTLRGNLEVRPEQNVDTSHPVDIKVTWLLSNRIALIEIKWLGNSISEDRSRFTAQHRDARAKSGAQQLAHYLDNNEDYAPNQITRGFLVVIDARRRGVQVDQTTISQDDGMHYVNAEIAYDAEHHNVRDDFDRPFRMFVEPKCL